MAQSEVSYVMSIEDSPLQPLYLVIENGCITQRNGSKVIPVIKKERIENCIKISNLSHC